MAQATRARLGEDVRPGIVVSIGSVNNRIYSVTSDGWRFLVMAPVTDPAQNRIAVILNWTAGLKR